MEHGDFIIIYDGLKNRLYSVGQWPVDESLESIEILSPKEPVVKNLWKLASGNIRNQIFLLMKNCQIWAEIL